MSLIYLAMKLLLCVAYITVLRVCVKAISILSASFCASPIFLLEFNIIYKYVLLFSHCGSVAIL